MQKNNAKMTWDTRTLVFLALLVAMHIVLVRLVVIDLGSYRITVGSVCTIIAGLWFGPVAGGVQRTDLGYSGMYSQRIRRESFYHGGGYPLGCCSRAYAL